MDLQLCYNASEDTFPLAATHQTDLWPVWVSDAL